MPGFLIISILLLATPDSPIFRPGRSWTYKVFFISPQQDTIDTVTARLEILEKDSSSKNLNAEWRYDSVSETTEILESEVSISINPPSMGKFSGLNLFYVPADYCKLDTIIETRPGAEVRVSDKTYDEKGIKNATSYVDTVYPLGKILGKSLKVWRLEKPLLNGEFVMIDYTPNIEGKIVKTLMKTLSGCLEIKGKLKNLRRDEKPDAEAVEAVFYFYPQYGFVRWKYERSDDSRVVFDLKKTTGF